MRCKTTIILLLALSLGLQSIAQVRISGLKKISSTSGNLGTILPAYDFFGYQMANIGDLDGDGVQDIAVSSPGDNDGGSRHGAIYVLFMKNDGTVKSTHKISQTSGNLGIGLADGEQFGQSVTNIGDLDGDGVQDLAVGAVDHLGAFIGGVYILFMKRDGTVKRTTIIDQHTANFSSTATGHFGWNMVSPGDVDGDGIPDLAVGAPQDNDGGNNRGAVYIIFLKKDGTVKRYQKISSISGGFNGHFEDGCSFGYAMAKLGDIDGDGIPDMAVSAVNYPSQPSIVFILKLNTNGTVKTYSQIDNGPNGMNGVLSVTETFGSGITMINDINGDGTKDMVVGACHNNDGGAQRGAVYVLYLTEDFQVKDYDKFSGYITDSLKNVVQDGSFWGSSVIPLNNFNRMYPNTIGVAAVRDHDGNIQAGAFFVLFLKPLISNHLNPFYKPSGVYPLVDTSNSTKTIEDQCIDYKLFPNPSDGLLNIDFPCVQERSFIVFDAMGRRIVAFYDISEEKYKFNFSDFASGIYFVRIITDGHISTEKWVKQSL